ncbi:hypothetical protein BDV95DRAFT_529194 [Massariosphaeria phaeospora]|uniref:MATH and UCH domain protein n=1 Tax=Massariosphaeria phaeospora TaxID=100035 RepID=A0A7C8M2W4_9PLEO|nr:hypothetical protein BDV95DRAFT_529194 [Massariosphaeria phaeospora]
MSVEQPPPPPPPVLFSPPSFSSPPQSPTHSHHTQVPVSSPPTVDDVEMSTSTTLPTTGQRHDREDALMQDVPDGDQGVTPPDGVQAEPPTVDPVPPAAPTGDAPTSQSDDAPPLEPPPPVDPTSQPPPPPPPAEAVRTESDSSDDEDGAQPWHPIQEDTSSPDEAELKEIEASTEISAVDHKYWEDKTFSPLEEPEYTPGTSGRIEWRIDNYNGTRDKPNREIVMKSEPVNVGGYDWQIKFYPKGNDSDYLSVYVECLSVMKKDAKTNEDQTQKEDSPVKETDEMEAEDGTGAGSEACEYQHAPLPLLGSKKIPKRKSVAAQVAVVLYNPTEPRVSYSRSCLHRFCTGSPDWGWTRFHGPYYDIPHRTRGQRQALLRDDKLAFTGYIRLVNDETNCLWEHNNNRENPWDSFAMTGLQSLVLSDGTDSHIASPPGGNMISTIASWMLFKPFREFLYKFTVPDPEDEPFVHPKPLIGALQEVLYMLRTQVEPGSGSVSLDDVLDALEWYGVHDRLDKLDVMQTWETLRIKIEDELRDTPSATVLEDLFGPRRDYANGMPSYRVSVRGTNSMQEALEKTPNLTLPSRPLPQLLTVELDRQEFDAASRSYVKLLNKVSLDDYVTVRDTPYTLYGFIVHKQTLQSYAYHPVLRPEGPGSKWYSYSDSKDENKVKCLPQRQAIDAHEGKSGSERVTGHDPVAYVAMYIRNDVAQSAFTSDAESEIWEAPEWLLKQVEKHQQAMRVPPPMPPPPLGDPAPVADKGVESAQESEEPAVPEYYDFRVVDSRTFLQHEGPGTFYAYDPKWQNGASDFVYSVQLASTDGCNDVRDKLADVVNDVQDPRQIKFWFLDPIRGAIGRPNFLGTGNVEYSSGAIDRYEDDSEEWTLQGSSFSWSSRRIWAHVIDYADLPELPKEQSNEVESCEPPPTSQVSTSNENPLEIPAPAESEPEAQVSTEDTPMSEPGEPEPIPEPQQPEADLEEAQPPISARNPVADDTAMAEVQIEVAVESVPDADPTAVDVVVSNTTPVDTEMGGTQEDLPPPPPPPTNIQLEPPPPPPEQHQPDEVYFFLKFFDPEKQVLESRGSHIVQSAARVDTTVLSILGLSSDKEIKLCEEEELTTTRPVRSRRSFAQNDLHNASIVIASLPLSEELCDSLAARAAFADPQAFLVFCAEARNFPSRMTGHFTHSHFSSQYYRGDIQNGHRHGHGYRIYHSGATYDGTFRLSLRHGHGLYTFQNGDTYDGDWVANQQHGTGTFVEAATGNTYVGGWKNDKKFGEGVTRWKVAQETERLCRICWEESADAAFYDCGHVVACLSCARRVDTCPVCRKRVLSAMKLYYVA